MRDRAKYSPFYLDIYVVIFYTVVQSDNNYFLDNMKIEPKIIAQLRKEQSKLLPVAGLKIQFEKMAVKKEPGHPDFRASVRFRDQQFDIIGEVVSQNNSAIFKDKLARLKAFASPKKDLVPVVVAQYLSERKREACKIAGVNYIDLSGNVLLSFENLYIERIGFPALFLTKLHLYCGYCCPIKTDSGGSGNLQAIWIWIRALFPEWPGNWKIEITQPG
jgi:hypothetical protein